MDPTIGSTAGIKLFDLAERKLAWIGQRQGVLAQNVANADTPGWKSRDIKPFAEQLSQHLAADSGAPLRTNPLHLPGTSANTASLLTERGEQAPDGNAVSLEQQMLKIAQTDDQHELVSAVYRKYLGMFRMALGR